MAESQIQDEETTQIPITPKQRREAFKAMLAYAKPYKKVFVIVFFCAMLAITADLLQPILVKYAIDEKVLLDNHGFQLLLGLSVAYLILIGISLLFSYLQMVLLQKAGQGIVAKLRKDLFEHISKMSMSFFDKHPIGSLVMNESSDTETISQFFTQVLLSIVRDGLQLIMIIGFMFYLDVQLALYCMILLPIIAIIAAVFRKWLRNAYQKARAQLSRMIAFIAENLSGMSLIQVFHQEKEQTTRFMTRNRKFLQESIREVRTSVLFNRSFDILGNVSVAFVVWVGGVAVLNQSLEFGVLYVFIVYIRQFFQPINQITMQWNTMQSTLVSVERLWRIFSTKEEVHDPDPAQLNQLDHSKVRGKIDFNHIQFAYSEESKTVLHDLDLHISPGEFIGIVGTTGAGKSSLVNLLARFYDVKKGSITIDDIDIRTIQQKSLHRIVGLVQQEPFLYSGSIIDNVRLFDRNITDQQVREACQFVGAQTMIERLRHGYDTQLSERGSGLSAGERQLISFARIIVFSPKILILDEATANLDSHTERLIQKALAVVSEGRTTLVIAHRLSTIQHADRIIVMRDGRICEEGTHHQLLLRRGYYAELHHHSRRGKIQDIG